MADVNATRTCVVCGGLFPREGKRTLCSEKCKIERLNAQMRDRRAERAPLLTCGYCRKEFKAPANTRYCCTKCKDIARRTNTAGAIREYRRKYAASAHGKAWREANKARHNESRNARRANVSRDRTYDRLRRKRMRSVCGALSHGQLMAIKQERCDCLYCGTKLTDGEKRLDHMDPLSKGGAHDMTNLVVACEPCNLRKSARLFDALVAMLDESRRAMVVKVYERKRRAPSCQQSLFGALRIA